MAPAALVGGIVLATVGGLLVDLPALALGVNITSSHVPAGLAIADTVVQDAGFIARRRASSRSSADGACARGCSACARRGCVWRGRRPARSVLLVAFLLFSMIWAALFNTRKEKLLEQLGANERTALLRAERRADLRDRAVRRGVPVPRLHLHRAAQLARHVAGGDHHGPAVRRRARRIGAGVDLVPLAALGFGLCLLYRATGSLYPCIAAHSLNNSIAFGSLESWAVAGARADAAALRRSG